MPGVFLSYRRKDGDYAALLYAWLIERFGAQRVFWDREDIDPGKDFREVLSSTLRQCDALVALIGPEWAPSEWIRREIGAGLRRRILVLPVLVGDAANLQRSALPAGIRQLAALETLETRDLRFRDRLIEALDRVVRRSRSRPRSSSPAPSVADDLRGTRLTTLLLDQIDRRQRRAIELLEAQDTGAALEVLNETFELVMALIDFRPGDTSVELRLGYLYKDLAQVFENVDRARFDRYVQSGLQTFQRLVELDLPKEDLAGSWNGLGNMYLLREEFDRAVDCCRRAVKLMPEYGYAWSDLLLGYDGQARNGNVDVEGMRRALAGLKASARGDPLLTRAAAAFEHSIRQWKGNARAAATKRRATAPASTR